MIENMLMSIFCFALFQVSASAGEPTLAEDFPSDFKDRAFDHAFQLAQIGPRSPGTEGEERALEYIRLQFEKMGLVVGVEKFDFETFHIQQLDFTICGENIQPETIGFNPYKGRFTFEGTPLFFGPELTSDESSVLNLNDAIIITTSPVDYFSLMFRDPRLIVYIGDSDFKRLKDKNCPSCSLDITGALETHTSANIIASLAPHTSKDKEVIISAHWDAYRDSPGADDNGSGIGVLLELARFFSNFEGKIDGTIKFVSFGAEELGIVGSRAYLNMHGQDLQNCILVFNMDQIGGPRRPAVEMLGGISGIPEKKGVTQFPTHLRNRTFEALDGRWRIIDPEMIQAFLVTNRPAWLVEAIETTAEQFAFDIRPAGNLGSDQQVFSQAGIVATSIGFPGNSYHGPEDVPSQIRKDNLEITAKLVANVALLSLRGAKNKR